MLGSQGEDIIRFNTYVNFLTFQTGSEGIHLLNLVNQGTGVGFCLILKARVWMMLWFGCVPPRPCVKDLVNSLSSYCRVVELLGGEE